MKSNNHDHKKISRALRDILLESTENELRDALDGVGEDFNALVTRGRAAAERAIENTQEESVQVEALHRGLGALVRMLRKKDNLSVEYLAEKARIDVLELRNIEENANFQPSPRTIYQLTQYFRLPSKSLVILSGAVRVEPDIQFEALRFAASSKNIDSLTSEEKILLNRFVKFLSDYTDK